MYYVYIWFKPNNAPFYVGIGKTAKRWNPRHVHSQSRNKYCFHTVLDVGAQNVIVKMINGLSREDACRLETTLISYYGRKDLGCGPLTNMTDGGDGALNTSEQTRSLRRGDKNPMRNPVVYTHAVSRMNDPEVIARYSGDKNPSKRPEVRAKLREMWKDPEFRAARVAEKVGKHKHSEEHKERMRQKLLDPSNPMREYHKILNSDPAIKEKRVAALRSPEVIAKIKAKLNDPEAKARRIAKLRATQSSPEWKERHGKHSAETKAKMSAAAKERWAKRKAT